MTFTLRPYQAEAIDAVFDYWRGGGGNPLVVIPTGGGKSLVLAEICRRLLEGWPRLRIGVVTHVKELIAQNAQELIRLWSGAPVGIYSAGLGRKDVRRSIMFMGIQSVWNKVGTLGYFDVLLIDECHLIGREASTRYGKFIAACRREAPHLRIAGLTATPFRLDSGRLDAGDDRIFDHVVYDANVGDLIGDGYLSPLTSPDTDIEINTAGLHVRAGEFVAAELEARARAPSLVEAAVAHIAEAGRDRRGWLLFGTSVEHATQVRDEVRKYQVSCEVISGQTPAGERDRIIAAFKQRQIRCLTSVGVLTTGFNAPHVDLVAMLMSTLSTVKYVQIVGRGFRPVYASGFDLSTADGRHAAIAAGPKPNCLVLDFGGNIKRHGPVDAVKPRKQGGGAGQSQEPKVEAEAVRAKTCPTCRELIAFAAPECPHCGHEFPMEAVATHEPTPDKVPILSGGGGTAGPQWQEVRGITFHRHQKWGAPDSLRIEVALAGRTVSDWLAFEHRGPAAARAEATWVRLGGHLPSPDTTEAGLSRTGELTPVTHVRIDESGKYPRIIGWRTAARAEAAE